MVSSGGSRRSMALFSLFLLIHTAAAARLHLTSSARKLGAFDVLAEILKEVDTMNTNLQDLSSAIDGATAPPPPSPTDEPTEGPSTEPPSPTGDSIYKDDQLLKPLVISRNFLTLELMGSIHDDQCKDLQDVKSTVEDAQKALNLVSESQLSNSTLKALQGNNTRLTDTTACVESGGITLDDAAKTSAKTAIKAAEETGEKAHNTIDDLINPTTQPPPEDLSGFKSATIALGVLFALALIAVVALAIVVKKRS